MLLTVLYGLMFLPVDDQSGNTLYSTLTERSYNVQEKTRVISAVK